MANVDLQATLQAVIAADFAQVDTLIRQRLHSDVVLVRQVAEYIVGSGGKRLRPVLVLLVAKALGYQGSQHIELAAVVEFIHTATLLHDDVVDESSLRRGNATANALFGNAASVLVGDFLYSRAFQMMVSCNNMRVMQTLADATNVIAEGEVLQLLNIGNLEVDEAAYLQVIQYKTAKLFEAGARLGAILCAAPAELETQMALYGAELGTAFQIIDDVLDYTGDHAEIGKNVGDDLAEGKLTLPLIYVLQQGTPAQKAVVQAAIESQGRDAFAAVLQAVQDSGALQYAQKTAETIAQQALSRLASLPESPSKAALVALARFAVERSH